MSLLPLRSFVVYCRVSFIKSFYWGWSVAVPYGQRVVIVVRTSSFDATSSVNQNGKAVLCNNGKGKGKLHEDALDGGELSASHFGYCTPWGSARDTHWIGGWMGVRYGLDRLLEKRTIAPSWIWIPACQPHRHVAIATMPSRLLVLRDVVCRVLVA